MKQILLIIITACLAIWTIVSLVQDVKSDKEKKKGVAREKVDLSEANIVFGENDLISPYPDSLQVKVPIINDISTDIRDGKILVDRKVVRPGSTGIDSAFRIFGTPQRYRTIVRNMPTYIYDEQGFYIITDSMGIITSLNIQFRKGDLNISPEMPYTKSLEINGYEIYPESSRLELIRKLGLTEIKTGDKSGYITDTDKIRLAFEFDPKDDTLVKVSIKLLGSNKI
jgi:hypothetical protein